MTLHNPDFVRYAEAFGARGVRVSRADDLASVLASCLAARGVSVIDVPIDYLGSSLAIAPRASSYAVSRVSSVVPHEVSP